MSKFRENRDSIMLTKNQIVKITIDSITNEGAGIGKYDGLAIFVPHTAKGDVVNVRIVKVHKTYCYGIVEEIITASQDRVDTECAVYNRCGGCSLRHISYAAELTAKQQWVQDAVKRLGGLDIDVLPVMPSSDITEYRNKAQYPFGKDKDGKTVCGFYANRSHNIIPSDNCALQPQFFSKICDIVCEYIDGAGATVYDEARHKGLFRHLYIRYGNECDEIMVCLVINGNAIPRQDELVQKLVTAFPNITSISLNHNTQKTNVILSKKLTTIHGNTEIRDILRGVEFRLSPLSFYQVNKKATETLYSIAEKYTEIKPHQLLLDLYCGAGTIGLTIAKNTEDIKLIGVEVIAEAVKNAEFSAQSNNIANTRFICADAAKAATQLAEEGLSPDVVIVDPPRKGCDQPTLDAIVAMAPHKLVMVSCNPATMARDCKYLSENGYKLEVVQPVDMFPRTNHVECVVKLCRVDTE